RRPVLLWSRALRSWILSLVSALQRRDVELFHLQECSGHPLHYCGISVSDHLYERGRHHLPGQAESVLEPAARALFAAVTELVPEIIDLLLGLAVDLEGNRLTEFELRAAVQRHEFLSFELESDDHHGAWLFTVLLETLLAVSADLVDARVLEDGAIEVCRLLCLGVEPQTGHDPLCGDGHDLLLSLTGGLADHAASSLRASEPQQDWDFARSSYLSWCRTQAIVQGSSSSSRPFGVRSR